MIVIVILMCLLFISLSINAYSEIQEIPDWIKHDAGKLKMQNKFNEYSLMRVLENLSKQGIIKNTVTNYLIYHIPERGEIVPVHLFGQINEHGKSGLVSLEIFKPDGSKEILRTPLLETGSYSTIFSIDNQSKKGTYKVFAEFGGKKTLSTYFYLTNNKTMSHKIPSWFVTVFEWWTEYKITDQEFISLVQYLADNRILDIVTSNNSVGEFTVSVNGQQMVRRGTTHTIVTHVTYGNVPVEGARVTLTIEDYDENIIKEFNGFSNQNGYFTFSWEISKKFDNIKTLLAYISVTYNDSSTTKLFKFQVYCLPGESNCRVRGN
ncbi:MAG: hypothetical protein JHC41_07985 [Nitrosopumilus sp.]|nr:hypothetical protein [Nitrosopumilus sp.]